ncbi:MAG: phosphoribosylformylglycinamidine cyclo-ligase [Armatimonadota bacterium]
MDDGMTYRDAGVDIDAAEATLQSLGETIKSTHGPQVLAGRADFGGMFALGDYDDPVLVAGADGVGTKLKIAFMTDTHDTVGQDLVAMNVDDIICMGARPLFFLDYLATGAIEKGTITQVVTGIAGACKKAGCALLGGETAEMPGFYQEGEYDLAGFAVGVVERDRIIDGGSVQAGDVIVGMQSSGLHSNGYSLVRKVLLHKEQLSVDAHIDTLGCTLGEELLRPTTIYCRVLADILAEDVQAHAIAHITGGGWYDNIARALPEDLGATLDPSAVPLPPIFELVQQSGNISDDEMYHTFNMGMGMAAVVPADQADGWLEALQKNDVAAWVVGEVHDQDTGVSLGL